MDQLQVHMKIHYWIHDLQRLRNWVEDLDATRADRTPTVGAMAGSSTAVANCFTPKTVEAQLGEYPGYKSCNSKAFEERDNSNKHKSRS